MLFAARSAQKLCLLPKSFGYRAQFWREILTHHNIYCEFSDADHSNT